MAERRLGLIAFLLFLSLCLLPCAAFAASTTDAKEPISTNRECALTICYKHDESAVPNQTVKLYKVADVSADFQYTLTSSFASSGLILNGVQTNGEWNVIRSTLEAHILANSTEPERSVVTDETGNACFESLKPGLYFTSAVCVEQGDMRCFFDSALIALPGLGTEGLWQYQVAVAAKPEVLPPTKPDDALQLKMLKLWKGDEGRTDRPQSIEVEIFRDGISYETVVLSEENHWSYGWSVKNDGASWKVVERNIPSGYTMTVAQRETAFVITNTRLDQPKPSTPQTGDTVPVLLYTALMYVSGMIFIILGVAGKRKTP